MKIYAVREDGKEVISIEYDVNDDIVKLPPLANLWHYEIEK